MSVKLESNGDKVEALMSIDGSLTEDLFDNTYIQKVLATRNVSDAG